MKIFGSEVRPHWLDDRTFFYCVETADGPSHIHVDCETGERRSLPAAPEERVLLRTATPSPTVRTGRESAVIFVNEADETVTITWLDPSGGRRSYGSLAPGAERRQHTYAGHRWLALDVHGGCRGVFEADDFPARALIAAHAPDAAETPEPDATISPDGRYRARIVDHDLYLELPNSWRARRHRLSRDGSADDRYLPGVSFSPDSEKLVAIQSRPAEERLLHGVQYLKPGDRIAHERPRLFHLGRRRSIPISEELFDNPWEISALRWSPDARRFTFLYNARGHQLLRLVAVDAATGAAESLIEERSPTFIDYAHKSYCRFLDARGEILWLSERDGYNHLYLFDAGGALVRQLTSGPSSVREILHVDEHARETWFLAGGLREGEDPYHLHLWRVSLDGGPPLRLTDGDGTHHVALSPDRRFFVDAWSRVDRLPISELRRRDGSLVAVLERADIGAAPAGWTMPERFVAKGRDGATDIHGIIIRPRDFDPARRYPVIEQIYAGPQDQHVPKAFALCERQHDLADRGFIVVQIDGMGTNWRGKAFHDVAWQNLADSGFPDRKAWLRAAAATRPYMDLERVGIYGGSAGGQSAVRALIDHHDVYRVAVADCGCHDNRMDKAWWNELWLGWPVGEAYDRSSNVRDAHRLRGELLLIVGDRDANVDPVCTMELVAALQRADKDFDLIVMAGVGHGAAETPYASRRRADFFVRHLLGA